MTPLSAVIITFNEEKNIERCLKSVQEVADEIIVVDSFSTDETEMICKRYSVNFIQRKWEGYAATKNFANASAKYDWILSLDADEELSPKLRSSIIELKKEAALSTCSFTRLTNYCGKWIKHCGWYPDVKVRIFNKAISKWEGEIHEELFFSQRISVKNLQGDCLHYSYSSISDHLAQVNKFSEIAAINLFRKGKKSSLYHLIIKPGLTFLIKYFFQLGFLDGFYGLCICYISAFDVFVRYAKLRQMIKDHKKP